MGKPIRYVTMIFAVLALATSFVSASRADIPWPENGAPVCLAPGDQGSLVRYPFSCGGLGFVWFDHDASPQGWKFGGVGIQPPVGACPQPDAALEAPGGREFAFAALKPVPIGAPGCQSPWPGSVWLQDSPASEELVGHFPSWTGHERVVIDDGVATRHKPRLRGSGNPLSDTAVVVVWSDERGGPPQIRAQRVNWQGAREWGPNGIVIAPTGAPQTEPSIVRLGDGSAVVIWLDERAGAHDVYALRLMPDGQIAAGWPALGLALEARPETSSGLRVAEYLDYSRSYVLWEEAGPRFGGGRQVVARALDGAGLPDPSWDALGVPLSDSPTVERLQDVWFTFDGFVAAWTDTRAATPSNPSDLYAQMLLGSGARAAGWPAPGRAICTAPGRQDHASVSGTFFAWEDARGADIDVYALMLTPTGALPCCEWVENGLPAAIAPGDQTGPVTGVYPGGGFVAWTDARDAAANGLDIWAQAFTFDGRKADVPRPRSIPGRALQAPAPNPSHRDVRLAVTLASPGSIRLDVLDLMGRRIAKLADGWREAGDWSFVWDGHDDAGHLMPPGVYRARLRSAAGDETRTVVRAR